MVLNILCIILAVTAITQASLFSKCDQDPEAISVVIDTCNDQHCKVKRNFSTRAKVTFRTTKEVTDLNASIHQLDDGFPWPLGQATKACYYLNDNLLCPLPANIEVTYGFGIKVPITAPVETETTIEVKLKDQDESVVFCTRIPVLVVD